MDSLGQLNEYNIPYRCKKCGGVMVFQGVGEYHCEDCGAVDYDDYGKVRCFIEKHRGATAYQIECAIGVSQRTIRKLLRDKRIQVAAGSRSFLRCELCGKEIRCGQFCDECEVAYHRSLEARQREKLREEMRGYGTERHFDEGQKRFIRKED
ncbi:MAG: hypothetical protein IJ327_00105 [Lachnospiraceae bacterium]|nr:hypothetical protein [Lachnospiraceae bacterium]